MVLLFPIFLKQMKFTVLIFVLLFQGLNLHAQINVGIKKAEKAHFNGQYLEADTLFRMALHANTSKKQKIENLIAYAKLLIDWEALEQADSLLEIA